MTYSTHAYEADPRNETVLIDVNGTLFPRYEGPHFRRRRREQPGETPKPDDEVAGQIQRVPARDARAQQQRNQLGVRERSGTVREQAVARRFALRPIANSHRRPAAVPAAIDTCSSQRGQCKLRVVTPSIGHRDDAQPTTALDRAGSGRRRYRQRDRIVREGAPPESTELLHGDEDFMILKWLDNKGVDALAA